MIHDDVWYCENCHEFFKEPKKIPGHGCVPHDWDSPDSYECPYCGSDDYKLADYCLECESVFPEDELIHGYCETCLRKLAFERGHEFIMADEDMLEEFAWWIRKRYRKRGA